MNQSSCDTKKQCMSGMLCLAAVLFLGLSLMCLGGQIKAGLKNFKSYDRFVVMKGLAERQVVADLAIWPISYSETGGDLNQIQDKMDAHGKTILAFLAKNGIQQDSISLQQVKVQDLLAQAYRQNVTGEDRFIVSQTYLVRTDKIDAVEKASAQMSELLRQGVVFSQNESATPVYLFTKLNDIKPEMIAEATQNANAAAVEFTKQSGQKVGAIKTANQGVFQILPRDQIYAVPEEQQTNKIIRVVSTIEFYLD